MGKEFNDSEVFINEELEFSIDDEDYFWIGSYEVVTSGEESDWEYMGDSETTINILGTIQLAKADRESGMPVDCTPTTDIESAIIEEIIRRL
jgi:hypothetical protein